MIRECTACPLHKTRRHAVPGEGDPNADWMFIGEAPGEKEDLEGRPFRGRSGRFFDILSESIGFVREMIYVTGSVKCRPPRNRTPRSEELLTCKKLWLDRQIQLIDPKLIVLLGRVAVNLLLEEKQGLDKIHGKIVNKEGRTFLITYHPAAGMRFPQIQENDGVGFLANC